MENIFEKYTKAIDEIRNIQKKINILKLKLNKKQNILDKLNEELCVNSELRDFFVEKILESYSKEELEEVEKYRSCIESQNSMNAIFGYYNIFDPKYDKFEIVDYEKNENDEIRFGVTTQKENQSISGILHAIRPIHYTTFFKIEEFKPKEKKDYNLRYKELVNSKKFKDIYNDKSLGDFLKIE